MESHPRSSVFHTTAWLTALRRTYRYNPVAFTTSAPGSELTNAAVFCEVESWLTGRRLVSLPFSDHCDLLFDHYEVDALGPVLETELQEKKYRYIALRSTNGFSTEEFGFQMWETFCGHHIDLRPELDTLFKNCHKNSTQRKIRRAEREGLTYEEGRSPFLLDCFYALQVRTRQRHRIPPQPRRWFDNLVEECGPDLKIRVAFDQRQPVAAIITIRHKQTLVYKYGCSDSEHHNLGGIHLLLWEAIRDGKQEGLRTLDLGRSAWDAAGLITFKDRWGAQRSDLKYLRMYPSSAARSAATHRKNEWKQRAMARILPTLPAPVFRAFGNCVYRHLG